MIHHKLLPSEHRLIALAKHMQFPVTAGDTLSIAAILGYPPSLIDFLKLFDDGDRFENVVDFINQCEELKLCILELRASSRELVYSSEC